MSRGKKAYLQYENELSSAIARLTQLREVLKAAIDADAEAFNAVMKAYKQAKESVDGEQLIQDALKQATGVPLGVAEGAREVEQLAVNLLPITNPNMKSDLTTAQALARAAIEGALANVEINSFNLHRLVGHDADEAHLAPTGHATHHAISQRRRRDRAVAWPPGQDRSGNMINARGGDARRVARGPACR